MSTAYSGIRTVSDSVDADGNIIAVEVHTPTYAAAFRLLEGELVETRHGSRAAFQGPDSWDWRLVAIREDDDPMLPHLRMVLTHLTLEQGARQEEPRLDEGDHVRVDAGDLSAAGPSAWGVGRVTRRTGAMLHVTRSTDGALGLFHEDQCERVEGYEVPQPIAGDEPIEDRGEIRWTGGRPITADEVGALGADPIEEAAAERAAADTSDAGKWTVYDAVAEHTYTEGDLVLVTTARYVWGHGRLEGLEPGSPPRVSVRRNTDGARGVFTLGDLAPVSKDAVERLFRRSAEEAAPALGRVRFRRTEDRAHFVVREGATGTVREWTKDLVRVHLDDHHPGAEEWDNEAVFTPTDVDEDGEEALDARVAARRSLEPITPVESDGGWVLEPVEHPTVTVISRTNELHEYVDVFEPGDLVGIRNVEEPEIIALARPEAAAVIVDALNATGASLR